MLLERVFRRKHVSQALLDLARRDLFALVLGGAAAGTVVGLTLRFALNAGPSGSQGFAPGKANDGDKNKTKNERKGDISKEL